MRWCLKPNRSAQLTRLHPQHGRLGSLKVAHTEARGSDLGADLVIQMGISIAMGVPHSWMVLVWENPSINSSFRGTTPKWGYEPLSILVMFETKCWGHGGLHKKCMFLSLQILKTIEASLRFTIVLYIAINPGSVNNKSTTMQGTVELLQSLTIFRTPHSCKSMFSASLAVQPITIDQPLYTAILGFQGTIVHHYNYHFFFITVVVFVNKPLGRLSTTIVGDHYLEVSYPVIIQILLACSIKNNPFWGTPSLMETPHVSTTGYQSWTLVATSSSKWLLRPWKVPPAATGGGERHLH